MQVFSVEKPDLAPFAMPDRFRMEIVYFMTPAGDKGVPALGPGEYWIRLEDARQWLDDGVISVVSPLDAANKAEIELSEDHEAWLEWLITNEIQHLRVSRRSP